MQKKVYIYILLILIQTNINLFGMTTLTVNNTEDYMPGTTPIMGSLREVISSISTSNDTTIQFDLPTGSTITLLSALPTITLNYNLTINGTASNITSDLITIVSPNNTTLFNVGNFKDVKPQIFNINNLILSFNSFDSSNIGISSTTIIDIQNIIFYNCGTALTNNQIGFMNGPARTNTISNNTFGTSNAPVGTGIQLSHNHNHFTIQNNTLFATTAFSFDTITQGFRGDNNNIEANMITANTGFTISNSSATNIQNNIFEAINDQTIGLMLVNNCFNLDIQGNTFNGVPSSTFINTSQNSEILFQDNTSSPYGNILDTSGANNQYIDNNLNNGSITWNPSGNLAAATVTISGNTFTGGDINIQPANTNTSVPVSITVGATAQFSGNSLGSGNINISGGSSSDTTLTMNNNTLTSGNFDIHTGGFFIGATLTVNNNTLTSGNFKIHTGGHSVPLNATVNNNTCGGTLFVFNNNSDNNSQQADIIESNKFIAKQPQLLNKIEIKGNQLTARQPYSYDAIVIDGIDNAFVSGNFISGHINGMRVNNLFGINANGNTITKCARSGMNFNNSKDCTISGNIVSKIGSSQEPISAAFISEGSTLNHFKDNDVQHNSYGFYFIGSDFEDLEHIVENNIINENSFSGIHFGLMSHKNTAKCNTINNNGRGITADGPRTVKNKFIGNSISENASKGIGLTNGANDNQAFPVLNSAQANGNTIIITGTLTSLANTTFRIEFFRNAVDRGPITEGKDPLGSIVVKTDTNGFVSFTARVLSADTTGFVSSTATVLDGPNAGDTSEFSLNIPITAGGTPQSAIGLAIFKKYCASEDPCAGT